MFREGLRELTALSCAHAGPSKGAAMQDYEPVSYNYSWFHFIFSLASMYIAMLMTGAQSQLPATCGFLSHALCAPCPATRARHYDGCSILLLTKRFGAD